LKQDAIRGRRAEFEQTRIVHSLYRPFERKWLYLDRVLNEEVYQWANISGTVIWVKVGADWPFFALASNSICDLLPQGGSQCFPTNRLKDAALLDFRTHYANNQITKEEILHYIYALLHHPEYRTRYAANLKRELPRIPFVPDFQAFAVAGKELARLHVEYESLPPWPLTEIENKDVKFTQQG
jgi:predicted helicase